MESFTFSVSVEVCLETFLSVFPHPTKKNNSKLAKNVTHLVPMNFSLFSEQVVKVKNLPLPGEGSHFKMEPEMRKQLRENGSMAKSKAKKAAVMAIFYPKKENTYLLLILRKEYPGVHSNQIGFPGGKVEKGDKDLMETAKRETFEEVGILPNDITVIKPLSEVYIPPSNFLVQPYIGICSGIPSFKIDPVEVESLVEVSLNDFMDEANLMEQRLTTSYANNILVPAFKLNGYTVWGATAMMLSEIKDLLKQVL